MKITITFFGKIGSSALFPLLFIEKRDMSETTLKAAIETYISELKSNCVFCGSIHGGFGEGVIYGQWWAGGIGNAIYINIDGITHCTKPYGADWIFKKATLTGMS